MKAIVCTAYGTPDVLKLRDVPKPVVGKNDVLIRVIASTVTKGDCELRSLTLPLWTRVPIRFYFGYSRPKNLIPGMEFAGIVEEIGTAVTNYKPGHEVFGSSGMGMGANAEYIRRPASAPLTIIPKGLSFQEAATIPVGGINALHFLRKGNIRPGHKVLVIGGGGAIGSYGILLAKYFGAEVTGVDNTSKQDMMRAAGADHVIDYTKGPYLHAASNYDVIFDTVYQSSYGVCINALAKGGVYLMANTGPRRMLRGWLSPPGQNKKVIFQLAAENLKDLGFLGNLVADGKIKPIIDKTFPLDQTPQAHAYVDSGEKKGCVVIDNTSLTKT